MSRPPALPVFLPLATVNAMIDAKLTGLFRSTEYKAGLAYIVRRKLANIPKEGSPYTLGTAQYDAWYAGTRHGHDLVRDIREEEKARRGVTQLKAFGRLA